jgi:hypothetical protein
MYWVNIGTISKNALKQNFFRKIFNLWFTILFFFYAGNILGRKLPHYNLQTIAQEVR